MNVTQVKTGGGNFQARDLATKAKFFLRFRCVLRVDGGGNKSGGGDIHGGEY